MNKRRSILGMTGAVVALVALSGSVMAAGPVAFQNGSFEDGTWAGSLNYYPLEAGQPSGSAMTGWTVTSGTVDWIDGYWTSPTGKSVDLNGTPTANVATPVAGTLTQTFATSANATYVVSFNYAGNPDGGPATKNATVSATGTNGQLITFPTTGHSTSSMGWLTGGYSFKATSGSTTITFAADPSNTSNQGIALDNIVITETLATGANCKKDGWRTMFDSAGTSFRNQGDCVSFYATGEKNLASATN